MEIADMDIISDAWDPWGPQQDINTIKVLNKVLDFDPPDLVVLNGDLITGENTYLENSTDYVDMLVGPMVERGLTWASTYGNHDYQPNITGSTILKRERTYPNARTRRMVCGRDAGVSNYYLPVYGSGCDMASFTGADGEECAPELLLWFFDSRGGFRYQEWDENGDQVGHPNWVDVSVVEWFQQTNADLVNQYQKVIPSLAFTHIPTEASRVLQSKGNKNNTGWHPNYQPGINDDGIAQQAQGWCPDGTQDGTCSYGGQDIPFMHALTTTPGVMALFSGHDHGDTWCFKWDSLLPGMTVAGNGINMCFGQHSGYGGYGNWIRGARQVLVSEAVLQDKRYEVDSWIRLESGDSVGAVTLNATYNLDWYPETPNDKTYCPTCNYTIITPMPGTKRR